jgi:hypothetical protein
MRCTVVFNDFTVATYVFFINSTGILKQIIPPRGFRKAVHSMPEGFRKTSKHFSKRV